jgi:hypothetical protein
MHQWCISFSFGIWIRSIRSLILFLPSKIMTTLVHIDDKPWGIMCYLHVLLHIEFNLIKCHLAEISNVPIYWYMRMDLWNLQTLDLPSRSVYFLATPCIIWLLVFQLLSYPMDYLSNIAVWNVFQASKLNVLKSCKGTVYWMAPEVCHHTL